MIKGNESLVENFNFNFLTPFYHNFKMLHFDANPITNGYRVMKDFSMLKTISQKQHHRHPTHSSSCHV